MKYKFEMFKEAIKDCFLYEVPNYIFVHVYKSCLRSNYAYEAFKNRKQQKVGCGLFVETVFALFISTLLLPFSILILFIRIFLCNHIILHRVEVSLTTFCSLKCKCCSNLMQYYHNPYHIDKNIIRRSIESLLEAIDSLNNLVLLGGEPFLYPDLSEILEYVINEKKIKNVHLISNGIANLDKKVIDQLKNPKVTLGISDYGIRGDRVDKTCGILDENEISYIRTIQRKWYDFGSVENKNRSGSELNEQYNKCDFKCKCILNGSLFVCPRASHGSDLGLYTDNMRADLINSDINTRKSKILEVYFCSHCIEACKFCDAGTDDCKEIDCGEQV